MNLFINYYIDPNPERQKEIDLCLINNLNNPEIERVYIFGEFRNMPYNGNFPNHYKIIPLPCNGRPTFQNFFSAINLHTGADDINIIVNSDIYVSLVLWPVFPTRYQCFALTRWDILPDGSEKFYNSSDSQDTWVFRGPIKQVKGADYTQGVAGCDNKIAWELQRAGYQVLNPSLTIKTYHLHNSGIRHYDKIQPGQTDIFRLPRPRIRVEITKL